MSRFIYRHVFSLEASKARRASIARALIFTTGLVSCISGILATKLGLGETTNFLLFRLFHLTRTTTVQIGFLLIVLSLLPDRKTLFQIGKSLYDSLRAATIKVELNESSPAQWRLFLPIFIQQLVLAIGVALVAFWLNRHNLLGYIDGQYLLTLTKNQLDFADWRFGFSYNPLQGIGDLWYFSNTQWIPELWVAHLASDPVWQRVAIQCTAFVEIFIIVSFLSHWLRILPEKAIASSWLAVFMITPLTYPSLIYNISADAPQIASLTTWPLIIVPLLFGVGRGANWLDPFRVLLIGLVLWLHFVAFGLFTALAYPFLAIVWTVFLATSWPNKNEFWRKAAWSVLLLIVLILSGLPQILLGFVKDSAFYSFRELNPSNHDLSGSSLLLRTNEPIGLAISWLGVVSAAYYATFCRGRIRWFALAVVVFGGMILIASLLYAVVGWSGAKPIYYEYMLWPVYPIFAASLLGAVWTRTWPHLSNALGRFNAQIGNLLWLALPLSGLVILHGANYLHGARNDRPNVYPPTATALTEYLRGEIGLVPGASFKGRVATLTGQSLPQKATWDQMFELDLDLIRSVGNDHRTIGLWYYNIPTLIEFSHTIPSNLYSVVKRYLAYKDDIQVRNLLNMRRPNIHVLQLLGVRYVITDSPSPTIGTHRVRQMPLPSRNTSLAIDEIPNPNLGVSPTETTSLSSDKQALDWLSEAQSNFNHIAMLAGPDPGPLAVATDIRISIESGGIRVQANSVGRSLVIIPFQYSHCLQAISRTDRQQPELMRANLILTGLLFNEKLDTMIQYRQGLFQGAWCRLDDFADNQKMGLVR